MAGLCAPLPTLRRTSSRTRDARLGADVDRYSFTVVDLHHLLLAGLPAHLLALVSPTLPDGIISRLFHDVHHGGSLPTQLVAV